MPKKFLDRNAMITITKMLDDYPDNETLAAVVNAIELVLDENAAAFENLGLSVDAQGYICQTVEVESNA